MIGALVLQTVRSILASWPRITLAIAALALPLAQQVLAGSEPRDPPVELAAALLLAGGCRADIRSGLLRSILGRPVTRAQYLLSRWAGGSLVLGGWALASLAGALIVSLLDGGDPPRAVPMARAVLVLLAACALLAAWFVAASAVLPPVADVALPLLLVFTVKALKELAPPGPVVDSILLVPMRLLSPPIDGGAAAFLVRAAGSIAVFLGLGLLAFRSRRVPPEARS